MTATAASSPLTAARRLLVLRVVIVPWTQGQSSWTIWRGRRTGRRQSVSAGADTPKRPLASWRVQGRQGMARNARVAVLGDLDDNGSIMEAGTMRDLGGRRPVHRVVGLLDDGTLKFIGADRADCPAQWRAVWRHRHKLNTNLARWLQTLATEPPEVVLLGAAIGLHAKAARAIARASLNFATRS